MWKENTPPGNFFHFFTCQDAGGNYYALSEQYDQRMFTSVLSPTLSVTNKDGNMLFYKEPVGLSIWNAILEIQNKKLENARDAFRVE